MCVSPLTSLMMDQRSKFAPCGISCEYVGEAQQDMSVIKSVVDGDVQLVFISPENLICNRLFRNMLTSAKYREHLVALVVDEAHCVKTW